MSKADVLGILGMQGKDLNVNYLRIWADAFDVRDLVERALEEAC